jgi:hypothetical protein
MLAGVVETGTDSRFASGQGPSKTIPSRTWRKEPRNPRLRIYLEICVNLWTEYDCFIGCVLLLERARMNLFSYTP